MEYRIYSIIKTCYKRFVEWIEDKKKYIYASRSFIGMRKILDWIWVKIEF